MTQLKERKRYECEIYKTTEPFCLSTRSLLVGPDVAEDCQETFKMRREKVEINDVRPALVAKRFKESSLSPIALTCPQRAKVVEVESARPFSSTSAMAIWTEAWSLEVMRRSVYAICKLECYHCPCFQSGVYD